MVKNILLQSLTFAVLTACTASPPKAPKLYRGSGDALSEGGQGSNSGVNPSNPVTPIPAIPTTIALASKKFQGEEDKLRAVVKYAGQASEKLRLKADGDSAVVSIDKLSSGKSDALVVEIYEGEKLRFKASKASVAIDKNKENSFKIEDCAIHKLPWSGEANEAHCAWSVEDLKN